MIDFVQVNLYKIDLSDLLIAGTFGNEVHHITDAFPQAGCSDLAGLRLLSFQAQGDSRPGVFAQEIVHPPALSSVTSDLLHFLVAHLLNPPFCMADSMEVPVFVMYQSAARNRSAVTIIIIGV